MTNVNCIWEAVGDEDHLSRTGHKNSERKNGSRAEAQNSANGVTLFTPFDHPLLLHLLDNLIVTLLNNKDVPNDKCVTMIAFKSDS